MTWREHWRKGRENRIPLCCIARWLLGPHATVVPAGQAAERGVRFTSDGTPYVPCRVIHR